jgi:hypothetical protein
MQSPTLANPVHIKDGCFRMLASTQHPACWVVLGRLRFEVGRTDHGMRDSSDMAPHVEGFPDVATTSRVNLQSRKWWSRRARIVDKSCSHTTRYSQAEQRKRPNQAGDRCYGVSVESQRTPTDLCLRRLEVATLSTTSSCMRDGSRAIRSIATASHAADDSYRPKGWVSLGALMRCRYAGARGHVIESVAGVSMFADTCAASLRIVLAHTHLDYHDAGWPIHCAVRRQTAPRLPKQQRSPPSHDICS